MLMCQHVISSSLLPAHSYTRRAFYQKVHLVYINTCNAFRLLPLLPQVLSVFENLHQGRIHCATMADDNMLLTGGDSTVCWTHPPHPPPPPPPPPLSLSLLSFDHLNIHLLLLILQKVLWKMSSTSECIHMKHSLGMYIHVHVHVHL